VNYDNSLVVTITVTCDSWTPSSGDHLFPCGAIYRPPHWGRPCLFSRNESPRFFESPVSNLCCIQLSV